MAPRPPGSGTGYTDIGQYLAANSGTLADERAQLAGTIGGELDKAKTTADQVVGQVTPGNDYTAIPGYGDALQQQKEAEADATSLGSAGGLQDLLQRTRGDSADQGRFDAQLLTGNPDLAGVQQRGSSLGDYLDTQAAPKAAPLPEIISPPGQGTALPPGNAHPGAPPGPPGDPNQPPGEGGTPTPDPGTPPRRRQGGY